MERLKVLVVDDEPDICSGIIRILSRYHVEFPYLNERFEFDCLEAYSGEVAIKIMDSRKIDIVLLDNKLPGMMGLEVLEYINKNNFDLVVMMITSFASLDLAIKATKIGAYNFVAKPFLPEELKSAMENISKHLFLRRMTRKMSEDDKQIRFQFLSLLSHELKSPINAVESYLWMIIEKQAGESIENYIDLLQRSVLRLKGMRNLIGDLLDLTKIETGERMRDIIPLNLAHIAKYSVETFRPMANQQKIIINLDSPECITIDADQYEIEIIFNNLISNAIKYNKESGVVNVVLKETNSQIEILVEDSGIGMTEGEISMLFQEFIRIKNMNTKDISGTGLGLSITKKIVELYRGEIKVFSKPDFGSKFLTTIPK
jgi:two-component system, sensor histidine kinase and response regulator